MTPDALTRAVQDFLGEAVGAVVLEDGAVTFDLARAKYSISGEYNKCLLHLWSQERNTVRRVLDAEVKSGTLRLFVQKLGRSRPTKLEICREGDHRSPSAKRALRLAYEHTLRRVLERYFAGFTIARQVESALGLRKLRLLGVRLQSRNPHFSQKAQEMGHRAGHAPRYTSQAPSRRRRSTNCAT
jgi:hypothetical protein